MGLVLSCLGVLFVVFTQTHAAPPTPGPFVPPKPEDLVPPPDPPPPGPFVAPAPEDLVPHLEPTPSTTEDLAPQIDMKDKAVITVQLPNGKYKEIMLPPQAIEGFLRGMSKADRVMGVDPPASMMGHQPPPPPNMLVEPPVPTPTSEIPYPNPSAP